MSLASSPILGLVVDRAALFHDLALALGARTGLPSLARELGRVLARHLPLVEVELARERGTDRALLWVFEPASGRTWSGERSSRVLEPMRGQLGVLVPCDDEVARLGVDPIALRLRLAIDRHVLGFAFGRALLALDTTTREQLLAVLCAHARSASVLARTAACSRRAHRRLRELDTLATPEPATHETATHEPATQESALHESALHESSDVPVFAAAQREAIARALTSAKGKIYGPGGAAELLGLRPSTLQSKMRKLGLDRASFVAR